MGSYDYAFIAYDDDDGLGKYRPMPTDYQPEQFRRHNHDEWSTLISCSY